MKVAYSNLPCLTLKDKSGKTFDVWANSYYELGDEINIKTSFREEEINRGWIGDLSYQTACGYGTGGKEVDNTEITDTYTDVLLASISIYEAEFNAPIIWEYKFLKK